MTSRGATTLDRYLLAKTRALVLEIGARMDDYDIAGACQSVLEYLEALNNWYIRRSRARFWKSEKDADKQAKWEIFPASARVAPSVPGVGEVWVNAQFERVPNQRDSGGVPKPGTITVLDAATFAVEREINGLAAGGPAERAGVHAGDLVVAVGSQRVSSLADLFRGIWGMGPAGTEIPLTLARGGGPVYVRVNSGDRNDYLRKPSLQ